MISGERGMALDQIVRPRALGEPLKEKLDGDPSAAKDGLAKHHARHTLDVLLPIHHHLIISRRSNQFIRYSSPCPRATHSPCHPSSLPPPMLLADLHHRTQDV